MESYALFTKIRDKVKSKGNEIYYIVDEEEYVPLTDESDLMALQWTLKEPYTEERCLVMFDAKDEEDCCYTSLDELTPDLLKIIWEWIKDED